MRRHKRLGLSLLVGVLAVVPMVLWIGGAAAATHGIGFQKGCNSPTKIGDPVVCTYTITNNNFTNASLDTVTINSLADVTHAASGDTPATNILGNLEIFKTFGNATCVATGGTGTSADPWTGVTSCSLPGGNVISGPRVGLWSSLSSKPHSGYVTKPADFNINPTTHSLSDDAKLGWTDVCDVDTVSCNNGLQTATAPSGTVVQKRASATATDIHNAAHQIVTVVAAGSTVHDFITVTSSDPDPSNPIPHGGNVLVEWFLNGSCTGSASSSATVGPVDGAGHFDATGFAKGPLAAGLYSFKAHYLGDGTYNPSDGACEPLRVVDADIQISPLTATNEIGTTHTFTAHVNVNDGTGSTPANAALVTFSIDLGPGTLSNGNTSATSCTTSASGNCTIDLNSATPGVTTLSAHTTVSVFGVSLTRNTDGTGLNSGPAVKTWVDANIQISPLQATNEVNNGHLFTAHVNVNTGTGGYVNAPNGTLVTFLVTSGSATLSAPSCTTSGGTGECSVTLNSTVAGSNMLQASTTVTVGGLPLTRTTGDGLLGDSPSATKTFVDASIALSPLTATNAVNQHHTVTATVLKNLGNGGGFVAAANAPVVFTVTGATANLTYFDANLDGDNNPLTATTNVSGLATLEFTKSGAGSVTINASTTFSVGGVSLTRDTDPATPATAGPGGTGPAAKTFVDANIALSPLTATNEVNQHHTVTATVMKDPGTGFIAAANAPVVFTVTGAIANLTYFDANADGDNNPLTATTDANGQATLEFTKSGAGSVTINGSTTFSVGGVSLTRDTDPATPATAGPGGTGPAAKTFVDGNIVLSPLTATNEVNQHHTVTATVKKDPGTGLIAAPNSPVVFTVTGATANLTYFDANADGDNNPLTATTDANGQATLEFAKSGAGSVTINASATISVGGLSLTRDTDPATPATAGPGGTGPAAKTFVDASIALSPLTATNEVNQHHTVTATVLKNLGSGGGFVAAGTVPVVFTVTGATANLTYFDANADGDNNPLTATTNASGQATLEFTKSGAGSVTINASTTFSVGGVSLTRDTDPATPATAGPGGTGPAGKTFVDANIQITPANATNPTGTNHILTGHVNINAGQGGGYVDAPDGTVIHFSIVSGPGSFVGPDTCTVSNGLGSCTATITSNTIGTTVVRATTDVTVGGLSLHRATNDGLAGDSADANKLWQFRDANIQISPLTATNEIGSPHTLTAHVNVNTGSGDTPAPAGTTINFTIVNGPGSLNFSSCTTIGVTGSCSVILTSSTAGVTIVKASSDPVVLGVALHRETGDGLPGDSANAQKTWVDANIQISPLTATNEIGTPHTFTAHVNVNTGTGGYVSAPDGTSISFSIVNGPGTLGTPNPCTTSGGTGNCSITLTSATPGVTTLRASTMVAVGGLTLSRATGDTHAGDSADALKTWVDANIQISPLTATNPVTATHTFTAHVNVNTGTGGYVSAPNGTQITFAIVSGPGTLGTPNPCTTAGGTGSCSITLTANGTGTTIVSATTTVSVVGQSLTRTTGDGLNGDSTNATKLWADDSVRTDILNAQDQVVTSGGAGLVVHDKAFVSKLAGTPASVPNPTGSVTFHRYTNAACTGPSTDQTVALTPGSPSTAVSSNFTIAGSMSYRADYLGDANYPARAGACEPLTVILGPCTLGYPDTSHTPRSSAIFNESSTLAAFSVNAAGTTVQAWYTDEHALTLGVDPDPDGTPVTPMVGTAAQHALNPDIGDVTAADGAGRPLYPAAFVTDITNNLTSRVGDWQQTNNNNGAQGPQDLFGTWKNAIKSGSSITPGNDPPANATFGPGADTPPAFTNLGYKTEVRWNLASLKDENGNAVQVGHSYRIVFMLHDGDQNNSGGDTGEACVNLTVPTPPPPSPPAITSANSTTFTEGTAGSFNVTATGSPAPTFSKTGALPSGVNFAADGTLSGTPATGTFGTYPITITASNGNAPDATQSFTLKVNPPPISGLKFNWISGGTNQGCTVAGGATGATNVTCTIKNLGAGTLQGTVSFFNGTTLPGIPAANNTGSTITIVPTVASGGGTASTANIPQGSASSQTLSITQTSTPTWTYSYTAGGTTYKVNIKIQS